MTRKELLTARSNDVVETALSREVCLSEAECTIVREVVLAELMRVEREVWGKVFNSKKFRQAPCYMCGYNGEGYYQPSIHPCADLYHNAQQQELG